MKTRWPLAALALLAFSAVPAAAQMLEMPGGKWWKRPAIVEGLKLSTEQQDRLDEVFLKNRRAFVDLKADVDRRTIDLEDLLAAKDADPKKVGAASEALEQARGRLGKARTMMVVDMKGILTEAQWKQIVDRRDQWRAEREGEMRKRMQEPARQRSPRREPVQARRPLPQRCRRFRKSPREATGLSARPALWRFRARTSQRVPSGWNESQPEASAKRRTDRPAARMARCTARLGQAISR